MDFSDAKSLVNLALFYKQYFCCIFYPSEAKKGRHFGLLYVSPLHQQTCVVKLKIEKCRKKQWEEIKSNHKAIMCFCFSSCEYKHFTINGLSSNDAEYFKTFHLYFSTFAVDFQFNFCEFSNTAFS